MRAFAGPDALRDLLRERCLTLDAVALLGECDESTVSRMVNGQSKPRRATVVHIARALGIKATRLQAMIDAAYAAAHADEQIPA